MFSIFKKFMFEKYIHAAGHIDATTGQIDATGHIDATTTQIDATRVLPLVSLSHTLSYFWAETTGSISLVSLV